VKNYWLIRVQDGPVEGPFTAAQIKSMASAGEISRPMLIADDSGNWAPAERVRGLFDPAPAATAPIPSSEYGLEPGLEPGVSPRDIAAPPLMAQGLYGGYAAPPPQGPVGKIRNMGWFIVLTSVLVALGIATAVMSVVEAAAHGSGNSFQALYDPNTNWMLSDSLGCASIIGAVALWIVWLVWIFKVHAEVRDFTCGTYPTSPGLALGLCFVPFFNIYWQIATPYKLAQFVEQRSRAAAPAANALAMMHVRQPVATSAVSAGTVLALQLVGTFGGCCIQGVHMLLFSITVLLIQRGLNHLWSSATPNQMSV